MSIELPCWDIARDCDVITEETHETVRLSAGSRVLECYRGADQDGWDGELICRLADGRNVAIDPENLAKSCVRKRP